MPCSSSQSYGQTISIPDYSYQISGLESEIRDLRKELKKVPCETYGAAEESSKLDKERISRLEDAFCSVSRELIRVGLSLPEAARREWEVHEAKDKLRIARENSDSKRKKLKQSGLAKLTHAERDALGLRGE
jgi:hypothetical protein